MSSYSTSSKKLWLCDICKKAQFEDYHEACRHEEQCLKITTSESVESKDLVAPKSSDTTQKPKHTNALSKTEGFNEKKRIDETLLRGRGNNARKRRKVPFKTIEDNCDKAKSLVQSESVITKKPINRINLENHIDKRNSSSYEQKKTSKIKESEPPLAAIFREKSKKGRERCEREENNIITDCSGDDRDSGDKAKGLVKKPRISCQERDKKIDTLPLANFFVVKARNADGERSKTHRRESIKEADKQRKPFDLTTSKKCITNCEENVESITQSHKTEVVEPKDSAPFKSGRTDRKIIDLTTSNKNLLKDNKERKEDNVHTQPLASIFNGKARATMLAEQRAIEFAMERRIAAEKERARQEKRAIARSLHAATKSTSANRAPKLHAKQRIIERFPAPSHINFAAKTYHEKASNFSDARMALCKSLKHPNGKNISTEALSCQLIGPKMSPQINPTFALLSSVSTLAPNDISRSYDGTVWTEKYGIRNVPCDIIGDQNVVIANKCIDFIESWKAERYRAHERRAEKQEKFALGKKKRRKRRKEDDIWDDSDDDCQLSTLFVLTGPTGCGKTSALHAIARHCGCKVLEINTAEKRDGQHLKNTIEEATLSDSTLDLLNKSTSKIFDAQQENLIDTDDEEDQIEGRKVPILLFDEINLIFEEHGDSGFWPALKTLSKKAKCPIFLTAETLPDSFQNISLSYIHHHMTRHNPNDCVQKIWQVLKSEGMKRREDVCSDKAKASLSHFAEFCGCDMRRILNELQLFACVKLQFGSNFPLLDKTSYLSSLKALADNDKPLLAIKKIAPSIVPANEMTILRLEVEDFNPLDKEMIIYVGDQRCPAFKVQDETTILAVCPPLQCSEEKSERECLPSRFPLIRIISKKQSISFSRGSHVESRELSDGSKLSKLFHYTIEYSFSFSQDEINFDDESHREEVEKLISSECSYGSTTKNISKCAEGLLTKTNDDDCEQLAAMVQSHQLESDLNYIEESIQSHGPPFLAGASRGFGSALLDGIDMCHSINANKLSRSDVKLPSTSSIIMNGWNDDGCYFGNSDVYMTMPCRRECRELSHLASYKHNTFYESSLDHHFDSGTFASDNEDDDSIGTLENHCDRQPEEDSFISRPSPIEQLYEYARHISPNYTSFLHISHELLPLRKDVHFRYLSDSLSSLWSDSSYSYFPFGIPKQSNNGFNSLLESEFEKRLHLDYGPLLASICVSERDSLSLPPTANVVHQSSRRTTRSSKKDNRSHYFEEKRMNENLFHEDFLHIGQQLASNWMEY